MAKPKPKPKKRWVTIKKAPPGTYDVGLDFQERAAKRGLADLIGPEGDITIAGSRALEDLTLGGVEATRQKRELGEDYATGVGNVELGHRRTMADLLSQQQGVERGYQQLAGRQAQTGRAAGLAGGFAAQAAAKRAGNMQWDLAPIDVARGRAGEDRTASLNDLLRQQQRGEQSIDRSLGEMTVGYGRGASDRDIQGRRAQREVTQLGLDLGKVRMQEYLAGGGLRRRRVGPKQFKRLKTQGVL